MAIWMILWAFLNLIMCIVVPTTISALLQNQLGTTKLWFTITMLVYLISFIWLFSGIWRDIFDKLFW